METLIPALFMLLCPVLSLPVTQKEKGDTQRMFDAMENLMSGQEVFDPALFAEIMTCMDEYDINLAASEDAAWAGLISYWETNGTLNDTWGQGSHWHEKNATHQVFHNVLIMQPCNYASNVAYYRVAAQICKHGDKWTLPTEFVKAMVQGFVAMGMGSAFLHGSVTNLGRTIDVRFIDIISYLGHQAAVERLPSNSSVLHELSLVPRSGGSSRDVAEQLTQLFLEKPPQEWKADIDALDIPTFWISFSGMITTFLDMFLDDNTADLVITELIKLFGIEEDVQLFIFQHFQPELRNTLEDIVFTDEEKEGLANKFLGTVIKLLYAFLWQEELFTPEIFFHPLANMFGTTLLKYVNMYSNNLTTFPAYDLSMQNGKDAYPGSERCNKQEPHAKWHLESANGLLDLMYLCDHVNMLISSKFK